MSWRRLAIGLLILGGVSCGPVKSTAVILDAEGACRQAEVEHAGEVKEASYYYHSATQYLEKAKEEQGYADYDAAIDFGTRAKELAEKARSIAAAKPRKTP